MSRVHLSAPVRLPIFGVALMLLLQIAPSCDASDPTPGTPTPPTTTPDNSIPTNVTVVDGLIGPEGGTVTHPAGAHITIPAGALAAATRITLIGIAAPSADTLGGAPLGQGFEAGPEGQVFLKPVEVVVPFDPARVPSGTNATSAQLRMAPHASSSFAALQSSVDLAAHTILARTVHFTQFVPAQNPNPVFITTPFGLPDATVGTAYTQSLSATGGATPYTWTLSSGSALPAGLLLGSGGSIAGTPTSPSLASFFLTVTDSASHAVQAPFTVQVLPVVNPLPVLTQIAPTSASQGSAATAITLTGSSFVPTSQALLDGNVLATTFVDASHLAASIPAAAMVDPGTHAIAVSSPAPGGGTSASLTFTVVAVPQNPVPVLATVTPTTLPISTVDTQIAITGSSFLASSSAAIDAQGIPTLFVSDTQLSATIPASYLAASGTLNIDVFNPAPGGGFSVVKIPITVGAVADAGTDASTSDASEAGADTSVADAAPPGSCLYNNDIYTNGMLVYPLGVSSCGIAPGYCNYPYELCSSGHLGNLTSMHMPRDVGDSVPAGTPTCISLSSCTADMLGKTCTALTGPGDDSLVGPCWGARPTGRRKSTGPGVYQCNNTSSGGLVFLGSIFASCDP